jgi:hypothetical protein
MEFIIYTYMAACFTLMVFNFGYMGRSGFKRRGDKRKQRNWRNEILQQTQRLAAGEGLHPKHTRRMAKKLTKPDTLIAYAQALEEVRTEFPEAAEAYIYADYTVFQELAFQYSHRESMERAFYADFIRRFPPCKGEYKQIVDILISYMPNSTIHCRENVLCALYALGHIHAVENALQLLNDNGWFHHQKLISDDLAGFAGDKAELAASLWENYGKWNSYLILSVVHFITTFSPDYKEVFLPILQNQSADMELRLAVMRYYRRYAHEPVLPLLLDYLADEEGDENLSIVAAVVLEGYPGSETTDALIRALSSRNWHVRYNASSTLVHMKTHEDELRKVLRSGDRYAKEILTYRLEQEGGLYAGLLLEEKEAVPV